MPLPFLFWGLGKIALAALVGAAVVGIAGVIYFKVRAKITAKNAKTLLEQTGSEIGQRLRAGDYGEVSCLNIKNVDTDSDGNTYVTFEDEDGNLSGLKSSRGTSLEEGETILLE